MSHTAPESLLLEKLYCLALEQHITIGPYQLVLTSHSGLPVIGLGMGTGPDYRQWNIKTNWLVISRKYSSLIKRERWTSLTCLPSNFAH